MYNSLNLGVASVDICQVRYMQSLDGERFRSLRDEFATHGMACPRTLVRTSSGVIYSPMQIDEALSTKRGLRYDTVDIGNGRLVPIDNVERIYRLDEVSADILAREVERLGPTFTTVVSIGSAGVELSDRAVVTLQSACHWGLDDFG